MTSTLRDSSIVLPRAPAENETSMRNQLWSLLVSMHAGLELPERRRQQRFLYPRLVYLSPVTADGQSRVGKTMVVAGKHLSERGLGFYHPAPLPYRWMIASLEKAPDEWLNLLLDVSWCRFSRRGWYESGGRFLRAVSWQLDRAG
jgi:hypothetical protein